MAIGTALAVGLGAAAVGGAIAGGSDETTTQSKNVAPAGQMERQAQEASWQNYLKQQAMAGDLENSVAGAKGIQDQARTTMDSIMRGESYMLSPEEKANLENVRGATIAAGEGDINRFVDQRLQALQGDAANRGVRGQALSQIQTGAVNEGTAQLGNLVGQANLQYAQQAMAVPQARMQLQGGYAQQNMSYQDQLRQQAMANRQALQNPALMSSLQNERLQAAGVTTTQEGSLGGAIGGAFGGMGSMLGAAGGAKKAGLF